MKNDYFSGKVALITGSARGIGFATAELLGRRGAKVVLSDVLDETLAEAESRLKAAGIEVSAHRSDVTKQADCEALVKGAVDRFGRLDILINNAGLSIVAHFEECRPEAFRKLVDVNILGSMHMTAAGLEPLKASRGHLIFVSSVSGIRAIPSGSVYSASKAFLRSFAESLRLELKPHGIHVGVITPGFTTSDSSKTVMGGDGALKPIDRPPHDTPEGVAKGMVSLIEKRQRERVLTPLGKATAVLQRISPPLVDRILEGRELKH